MYPMHAFLWDLASLPTLATVELATLSTNYDESIAYAVNDSSPAVVVGRSATGVTACEDPVVEYHGFRYLEGDPSSSVHDVGPSGGGADASVLDVNSAFAPTAIGTSSSVCVVSACVPQARAINWTLSVSPTLTDLLDNGTAYGAAGYGVNESGYAVGLALTADSECIAHASFWSSSTATLVDLGAIGISTNASVAYKLTNAGGNGELTVVGTNLTLGSARRWYRDSGGIWTGADLNSMISPACGWHVTEALDVSDDGWIVGYGTVTGETHGFLLKPIDCADLDGDCQVDGADLGSLLGAWNCTGHCGCFADFNIDGIVDGSDLGFLLGHWAECPCACSFSLKRGETQNPYESALVQALSILGFDSLSGFEAWEGTASSEQVQEALDWLFAYLLAST
jgi:hypothetical protein